MKKVVDGKRYNTETAEVVAEYYNGLGCGDFRRVDEALYRTNKGSFFLAGEGGPMTKYSRAVGDMTGGGEDIIPMSGEEALSWLESKNETEAIEKYFRETIEDA